MTTTAIHQEVPADRRRVFHWRKKHKHRLPIVAAGAWIILVSLLSYWAGIGACAGP